MSALSQAEWLRNRYKDNINILINHRRLGLYFEFWDRDFAWAWEQYKITQRIYVHLKRGVKIVDAITFEEGEG